MSARLLPQFPLPAIDSQAQYFLPTLTMTVHTAMNVVHAGVSREIQILAPALLLLVFVEDKLYATLHRAERYPALVGEGLPSTV